MYGGTPHNGLNGEAPPKGGGGTFYRPSKPGRENRTALPSNRLKKSSSPECRLNTGLRTFYARASRLWNRLGDKLKNMTNESNFKKHLLEKFLNINASRKHFSITRPFKGTLFIFLSRLYGTN